MVDLRKQDWISKNIYSFAFILSLLLVVYTYLPLLLPLARNKLEFSYGDFLVFISPDSSAVRNSVTFFTFSNRIGSKPIDTIRALLLEGAISLPASYINLSDSQIQSTIIAISIILGCYGWYRLIEIFEKNRIYKSLLILLVIPFYFLNLWSTERIIHLWIWTAYSIIPFLLWTGISYILNNKTTHLITYSIIFAFFAIIPHSFIYLSLMHLFLILLSVSRSEKFKYTIYFSAIPLVIYFFLNLPLFILVLVSPITYPTSNLMTLEQLTMLSRYGDMAKIVTFSNFWWPQFPLESLFDNMPFRLSSLGIFIAVLFLSIVSYGKLKKNDKALVLLSLIFILLSIFMSQGTNNPILYKIIEFVGKLGYINLLSFFREWERFCLLIPSLLSLIILVSIRKIQGKEKNIALAFLFLLLVVNVLSSPSLYYLSSAFSPTYFPNEYYTLSKDVSSQHKSLWIYPDKSEDILGIMRYPWDINKTISNFFEYTIGSTYPKDLNLIKLMEKKESPVGLLNALDIKYVILRTDVRGASDFPVEYTWLNCKKPGYLTICENKDSSASPFSAYTKIMAVDEDALKLYTLAYFFKNEAIVTISEDKFADSVVFDGTLSYTMEKLLKNNGVLILTPFTFSYRYNPNEVWSIASTSDPLHNPWHPYLEKFGIENWQEDYGKGLVFTLVPTNSSSGNDLKMNFRISNPGDYHLLVRYFKNKRGDEINVFLDGKRFQINTTDQLSKFVWKDLGKFYLEEGEHNLILRNINGFNAVNLFAFVPDSQLTKLEKELEVSLENKTMIHILEGESDFYGNSTTIKEMNDTSNGKVLEFRPPGSVWQEFEVTKAGYYRILVRAEAGFDVELDNTTFSIFSENFSDLYLGPVYLEEGSHKIKLESKWLYRYNWNFDSKEQVEGWKGITYASGPVYNVTWDEKEKVLRTELYKPCLGSRILISPMTSIHGNSIYTFNFSIKQSNFNVAYYGIAEFDKDKNELGEYYGGRMISYRTWENIIYDYRLTHPSAAYLQLRIWSDYNAFQSFEDDTILLDNVTILGSKPPYLDAVLIYSVNSPQTNLTIEDLFNTTESSANLSFNMVNPTLWKVQVNAAIKPFMLSFAESYDPSWEAVVYKDNKIVEKVEPILLYTMINGFWINETGDIEIVIRYKSQDWFEDSLIVSELSFVICLSYLIYMWRKDGGDGGLETRRAGG